jgi:hypothetical protein
MSVNGNQLPPVMPATVPRVTADGTPTKYLLDWEDFTSSFYTASLNDLQSQVTTVSASYGSISANGQISIQAVANPGGATAAYGVFLTAGSQFTGLTMIAKSGGGSAIAIAANQFTFTDTGTSTNVFSYSGGVFNFNVPVTIRNQDIGSNAVSNSTGASSNSKTVSTSITVRSGARVSIIATFDGDPNLYNTLSTYTLTITNATTATLLKTAQVGYFASGTGASTVERFFNCCALAFDTPAAGANTYTAALNLSGTNDPLILGPVSILVTELSR